jgi:hypothetical protein
VRLRQAHIERAEAARLNQRQRANEAWSWRTIAIVQAAIEAFKVAFEAQRYTSPAHLRALAIQQLTEHSLNPEFPAAQRVKCLELIGKMTEVSLFTERREIIQVTDSAQIKDRLMDTLRTITQAQAQDVTTRQPTHY